MKKLINWLKESHHGYHLAAIGLAAIVNLFLLHSLECSLIACFIGSLYTAAGIGLALEFKDKAYDVDMMTEDGNIYTSTSGNDNLSSNGDAVMYVYCHALNRYMGCGMR